MLDLQDMPADLMILRGQYATVRSAHEDSKKQLQILCGKLGASAAQILRKMQPDNDAEPVDVVEMLGACRLAIDAMEITTLNIQALAKQRAELKPKAWGR